MMDERGVEWFIDDLSEKIGYAESNYRNWTHGVIGDEGYPAEIVLTTIDARRIVELLEGDIGLGSR